MRKPVKLLTQCLAQISSQQRLAIVRRFCGAVEVERRENDLQNILVEVLTSKDVKAKGEKGPK